MLGDCADHRCVVARVSRVEVVALVKSNCVHRQLARNEKTGRALRVSVEIRPFEVGDFRISEVLVERKLRHHVPKMAVRISFGLNPDMGVPNGVIRIVFKTSLDERKSTRVKPDPAIEEQDELSRSLCEPACASRNTTGVTLGDHLARQPQIGLVHCLDRPVGRTVVDDHDVERQTGRLRRGGLQMAKRLSDPTLLVEDRDDDRHGGDRRTIPVANDTAYTA